MRNIKKIWLLLFVSVGILTFTGNKASAATSIGATQPSDGTYMGIGGVGSHFDAPESISRLYIPAGQNSNLTIWAWNGWDITDMVVTRTASNSSNSCPVNRSTNVVTSVAVPNIYGGVSASLTVNHQASTYAHDGYDVYCVWMASNTVGVTYFTLTASNGLVGNDISGSPAARTGFVHDLDPQDHHPAWTKRLDFAPLCVGSGNVFGTINFYDLDLNSPFQGNMTISIYQTTSDGANLPSPASSTAGMSLYHSVTYDDTSANHEDRSIGLNFRVGRKYRMVMSPIGDSNAFKVSLPFEEFNAARPCNPDVCPNLPGSQTSVPAGMQLISGNCYRRDSNPTLSATWICNQAPNYTTGVRVTSSDADGPGYTIQYRRTAPTVSGWVTVGRSGDGYFYINAGSYGANASVTFQIRTNGTYPAAPVWPGDVTTPEAQINYTYGPCYRNIQGTVYNAYTPGTRYAGLTINTCVTGVSTTTNGSGAFTFRVNFDDWYCVRIASLPAGANSARVRPYSEGYAACGGYGGLTTPLAYCASYSTYESQYANGDVGGNDRVSNSGFDFVIRFDPVFTCTLLEPLTTLVETGTPIQPRVRITYPNVTYRPHRITSGQVSMNIAGYGTRTANFGIINRGSSLNVNVGAAITPTNPGIFTTNANGNTYGAYAFGDDIRHPTNVNQRVSCGSSVPRQGNLAYLKEFGGEIWSGGNFLNTANCSPPGGSSAGIYAHNRNASGTFYGASSQYATTALSQIFGYNSLSNRNSTNNQGRPPKGMTFANSGGTAENSTFGGGFGAAAARCITDYYDSTIATSDDAPEISIIPGTFPPGSSVFPPFSTTAGVNSTNSGDTTVAVPGAGNYRVEVVGTYRFRGTAGSDADAYCANDNTGSWGTEIAANTTPDILELWVEGVPRSWIPVGATYASAPECSTSHRYTVNGVYISDGAMNFRINDNGHTDNLGTLTVTVTRTSGPGSGWTSGRSQYHMTGNRQIGSGADIAVPNGSQVAVYVDGDAYIRSNVIFDGGYNNNENMPYFALIAKGNIYIDNDVTRLDGLYIAQPRDDGTRGTLYTCGRAINATTYTSYTPNLGNSTLDSYAQCQERLAINGSVVANRIKWGRVLPSSSLRDATFREVPDFETGLGGNTRAAEVINFTPQMWLAPSPMRIPGEENGQLMRRYESLRSLPPIF